jgi:hypothetical protein
MKIGFALYSNLDPARSQQIHKLSMEMEDFFAAEDYGEGVKSIAIGIRCMSAEFAAFFKVKPPKYFRGRQVLTYDGISTTVENAFSYEITVSYELLSIATEDKLRRAIAYEILNSQYILDGQKHKIKDFDFAALYADMVHFFEELGLCETMP